MAAEVVAIMSGKKRGGDWCLLRTNGRGTLRLADSLSAEGIEAWSPSMVLKHRVPRSKRQTERRVAIMPSFVFARVAHIDRLLRLAQRPGRHEQFSMFRYQDNLPLFSDMDLEPLRTAEEKAVSKSRRRVYRPGQMVRVPEGSFAGMSGIVEKSEGGYVVVAFGGAIRVKIAAFLLRSDVAEGQQPLQNGTAARAA